MVETFTIQAVKYLLITVGIAHRQVEKWSLERLCMHLQTCCIEENRTEWKVHGFLAWIMSVGWNLHLCHLLYHLVNCDCKLLLCESCYFLQSHFLSCHFLKCGH